MIDARSPSRVWACLVVGKVVEVARHHIVRAGPGEWGDHAGKPILVVRALYGLKGSGQAWRSHLATTLRDTMGFTSCLADPDVWYKASTKPDGTKYYSYLLIYVDVLARPI